MKRRFEFIKETGVDGCVTYYTKRDGVFVLNSLKFDRDDAYKIFQNLLETPALPTKEVIEMIEREEV